MNRIVLTKLVVFISCTLLFASCGNGGDTKPAGQRDSANSSTTTAAPPAPAAGAIPGEKGLELIGASDCTTCHRLHQTGDGSAIGPAYDRVAAKYSPAPDTTIDRLVKKIISGGSGVWGAVPMTPHPALVEGDVKEMVKYILTLKK